MNGPTRSNDACRNPGCSRPAESDDAFCFACGLERSLYERDTRPRTARASARNAEEEPRR